MYIPDGARRFYVTTCAAAVAVAVLAAVVNTVVGPVNLAMWIAPLFLAVWTSLVLWCISRLNTDAPKIDELIPWTLRRILGRRTIRMLQPLPFLSHWVTSRVVTWIFVAFTPVVLLGMALVLLVQSIRGQIYP